MKKRALLIVGLGFAIFGLLILFSLSLILSEEIPATESCFVQLSINESFNNETNVTSFSLAGQENLYGFYDGSVPIYSDELSSTFLLNILNSNSENIGKYPLESSRFILYDNFEANCDPETDLECSLGGIVETESGVIDVIFPYSADIASASVENEGVQTDLGIDTSQIKCERTCKIEGELGSYSLNEYCCLGFSKIQISDDEFTCSKCGDGVCSAYESELSCFEDCGGDVICANGYKKTPYGCVIGDVSRIVSSIKEGESNENILVKVLDWVLNNI